VRDPGGPAPRARPRLRQEPPGLGAEPLAWTRGGRARRGPAL